MYEGEECDLDGRAEAVVAIAEGYFGEVVTIEMSTGSSIGLIVI